MADGFTSANDLLLAIQSAQALFVASAPPEHVLLQLLEILLRTTQSEYGFLTEVVVDEDGRHLLRGLTASNPSWAGYSRGGSRHFVVGDMEFRNLENLLGAPLVSGRPVVANHPAGDPRAGGTPPDHPPLRTFLGVPLRFGGDIVGVAGIANREGGYCEEIAESLAPLLSTCAGILHAVRTRRKEEATQQSLRESEARFLHDVTERRRSEEALRRSRNELRAIYDSAPVMMCVLDRTCRVLYANRAMCAFAGSAEADLSGAWPGGALGCLGGLDDPRGCGYGPDCGACSLRLAMLDTLCTGAAHRAVERPMATVRGGRREAVVLLGATELIQGGEQPLLLLCLEDITHRKQSEAMLIAERDLALALASIQEVDDIVRVSLDAAIQVAGMDSGGVYLVSPVSGDIDLICHRRLGAAFLETVVSHRRDSPPGRATHEGKPLVCGPADIEPLVGPAAVGEGLQVLMVVPVLHEGRPVACLYVASHTATEAPSHARVALEAVAAQMGGAMVRASAQQALRERDSMLRRAEVIAGIGSVVWDARTRLSTWSPNVYAMCGLEPQKLPLRLEDIIARLIHPDDRERFASEIGRMMAAGKTWPIEYRVVRPDGTERVFRSTGELMFDAAGRPLRWVGVKHDITREKEDERRLAAMESQLRHASRLATLGELAAGIAHELNQPLCAIVNFAKACGNVASHARPDLEKICQWSEAIALAAAQSGETVRRLCDFARRNETGQATVQVQQLILDALMLVWFEAQARKVTVVKDLPEAPLWVRVNPIQIRQVLVNLLINAMEAFTGDPLEDHRVSVLAASDSGEVRVSIVDTGPGLGSAKPGQLFAPFFTTKPQGLGMGLAISKTIVEDHGGRIWACAAKPHGAAFHFALPECTGSEGHGCE